MTATSSTSTHVSIDPATELGPLALTVSELGRSLTYYTQAIGLTILEQRAGEATLGVGGVPLLTLTEQPGATPWPRGGRSYTGLYHFAILVPERADLGRWLRNWLEHGLPLPGQGDHNVSEALYLEDPDGHGIEVYRDRPRDEWEWVDGQVRMASDPVDLQGLLDEAERAGLPWSGLPDGTRIGHIHLQVGDIAQARAFYSDVLGFDVMMEMPTALFMSAGSYHHHIGANVWHSRGASAAPDDSVRLRSFTIVLADASALEALIARFAAAGTPWEQDGATVSLLDPWGLTLRFVVDQ